MKQIRVEFQFLPAIPLQSQAAAVQENKMTVTLIAVVLLFLVCQTPTSIFLLYKVFVNEPTEKRVINLWLGKSPPPDADN